MGLETVTYIPELNQSNPIGASDPKSEGDDHLRNIKKALLNTFGSFVGTAGVPKSVTLTEDQINDLSQKLAAETIAGDKTHTGFIRTDDSTTTRAGFRIPTGVAPTSPAQGDMWATATDLIARINGSDLSLISQPGAAVTKFRTNNQAKVNDTLTDDNMLNGWSLDAATHYKITGFIKAACPTNAIDLKAAFQLDNAPVFSGWGLFGTNQAAAFAGDGASVITSTGVIDLVSTFFFFGTIVAHVRTHATLASTLDFQWAQNVTNASAVTIYGGSWITVEKIG